MSAMDKSLDEIIASKPRGGRKPRRGSARAQILGKTAPSPGAKAKAAAAQTQTVTPAPVQQHSAKIIISNLPNDVTEPQIKELFSTTIGPLREVTLNYDANGKSKGVASIVFVKQADAKKAFSQYHNRLIDGKRAMKIELVVDPTRPVPLAARVAPPVQIVPAASTSRGGNASGGRGRRGGRGRGRGGRSERPPKTAADLDAEMEDYTNTTSEPAAAPAAAAA